MGIKLIIKKFVRFYKKANEAEAKSHEMYCLARQGGDFKVYTEDDLSRAVEKSTSLTKADLSHAFESLFFELREFLVRGDRVRIKNIGTFYMNIASASTETPDELSVRSIERVNIRFLPDKSLKLVNNAIAPTRSDNNVTFSIVGRESLEAEDGTPGDDDEIPGGGSGGDDTGGGIDPDA